MNKKRLHNVKRCGGIGLAMLCMGMFFSHWFIFVGGVLLWVAVFMGVNLAVDNGMPALPSLTQEALVALCLLSCLGALNGCIRNGVLSLIVSAAQIVVIVGISLRSFSLLHKLEQKVQ